MEVYLFLISEYNQQNAKLEYMIKDNQEVINSINENKENTVISYHNQIFNDTEKNDFLKELIIRDNESIRQTIENNTQTLKYIYRELNRNQWYKKI
jgi:elongation factor P--beta-lysine ligase